jgi:hypothetical protein
MPNKEVHSIPAVWQSRCLATCKPSELNILQELPAASHGKEKETKESKGESDNCTIPAAEFA